MTTGENSWFFRGQLNPEVTCPWGKQNLLVKYLHRLNQNMYFWIFTFFIMPHYMVKLVCFSSFPHTTYRYILIWLLDKLTSKTASCNYAKLPSLAKCFPKSYINLCRFLIHFVFSSIRVKWAYKRWRAGIILNYKNIWMLIYTKN